jgi:hypothetical protein
MNMMQDSMGLNVRELVMEILRNVAKFNGEK